MSEWTSVLRQSKNLLIGRSPFFILRCCAFALVCELKCKWIFSQSWKECLHPMTLAKNDAERDDCNHESRSWSCVSHALYSGFSIPRSQWERERYCEGIRGWTKKRWRRCVLITSSTYCFQIKTNCVKRVSLI